MDIGLDVIKCVQMASDEIETKHKSSLNDICKDTAFISQFNFEEWTAAVVSVTREWPENARPTVAEAVGCCHYWRSEGETETGPTSICAANLIEQYVDYRPSIIEGILRSGETMNVIAAPKVGKSWLVLSMLLSLSNGDKWLGMDTEQASVLLVDNELHPETMAQRLRAVSTACKQSLRNMHVLCLRGHGENIDSCRELIIKQVEDNNCRLIVLDALYRFLPPGTSENDNAAMTELYNKIDSIAKETDCAIVLIHHASKGSQADKSVTDGGAGAGAVSRAADAHVFLREHEEEGCVVFDSVSRSWPAMDSFVIKSTFTDGAKLWDRAGHLDPALIKGRKETKRAPRRKKEEEHVEIPKSQQYNKPISDDENLFG